MLEPRSLSLSLSPSLVCLRLTRFCSPLASHPLSLPIFLTLHDLPSSLSIRSTRVYTYRIYVGMRTRVRPSVYLRSYRPSLFHPGDSYKRRVIYKDCTPRGRKWRAPARSISNPRVKPSPGFTPCLLASRVRASASLPLLYKLVSMGTQSPPTLSRVALSRKRELAGTEGVEKARG